MAEAEERESKTESESESLSSSLPILSASTSASLSNSLESSGKGIFTRDQVAKHNKQDDCWVIIRGKVYDVTQYLFKHPGGMSLLFKNAGCDATSDFEGMFHSFRAKGVLSGLEIGSIQGEAMASRTLTAHKHKIPPLSVGTVQEEEQKSTKEKDKKNKMSLDKLAIHQSPAVMHKKSVTLFELSEISIMTHDTKIFRFKVDKQLNVPVGYHISIIHTINGKLKKRNYTPITDKPKYFEIMVKLYKTKKMSEHLHKMKPKDKVGMMGPFGKWKHIPGKYTRYIMLAAGTGITPMYQVLSALNAEPPPQPSSHEHATSSVLLYANKTRKDVLLKKKLDYWNCSRFAMHYILSDEPTPDNEFLKGQIDRPVIESVLKPNIEDKAELVLICGPNGFCSKAEEILAELQYPKERIIVF